MKRLWLLALLLFATTARADNVDKLSWNPTLKVFQAVTHASGTKTVPPQGQIVGTGTNDAACTGCVGEVLQTLQAALQTAGSSNAFHTALSTPALQPGNYCLYATFNMVPNGGTCTSPVEISVTTGANGGASSGYDDMAVDCPTSQTMINFPCIPVKVGVGATATYNLNYDIVWGTTAPRWRGSITAVRIR